MTFRRDKWYLWYFKWYLWYFGFAKVPMIGYLHPKLITLNERDLVLRISLNRRSRNHLDSMYFGALAVGADLAGGFHAVYHSDLAKCKTFLVFKSFQAQFFRRPESDVYFVSSMGETVKEMITESKQTGEMINKPITVKAYTHYLTQPELVANLILDLTIKVTS